MSVPIFNFRHFLGFLAIVIFLTGFSILFTSDSYAANGINRTINFQGKLVNNSSGTNVTDGSYKMVFTLYDNPNAGQGTALWSETYDNSTKVTVTDGIFRVALGSQTAIPANFNFNWDGLYLGVKVGSDSEMTPRIQMAAVPFAFNAQQVAGLTVLDENNNASTSGTLKIPNAKTVAFAGATSFGSGTTGTITLGSNSDALTLTTSGTTNLSLPAISSGGVVMGYSNAVSTGTLASITNNTSQTGAETGLAITLGSSASQNQYGIQFALSGPVGVNTLDLRGTGGAWYITSGGALHVASCDNCAAGVTNWWNLVNGLGVSNGGYVSPINSTADLLIGSQATSSAVFAVLGLSNPNHQTTASVSGNFVVMPNNGWGSSVGIGTTNPVPGAVNSLEALGKIKSDTQLWAAGSSTGDLASALYENFDASATDVNGVTIQVKLTNPTTATIISGITWHKENGWSTTASTNNADLILTTFANASQYEVARFMANGSVGFGTTTPQASFDVRGNSGTLAVASFSGQTSFASLVANNNGVGDLFTASASGWTRFRIDNSGNVSQSGTETATALVLGTTPAAAGVLRLPNNSYITARNQANNADVNMIAVDTSNNIALGASLTIIANGSINSASAGTLSIATSNTNGLTIGGSNLSSGMTLGVGSAQNFTFQKNGAAFQCSGTDKLTLNGSGQLTCSSDQYSYSPFEELTGANGGVIVANNSTMDVLFGGQSSASAAFKVTGQGNPFAGTLATASVSAKTSFAGLVVDQRGVGDIFTASASGLAMFTVQKSGNVLLGGNNVGLSFTGTGISSITTASNQHFVINPGGSGLVGINTDGLTPLANFDVRTNVGTVAIASVSGATSFAALVVDNSGAGDLIAASTSGLAMFVVKQNGSVGIGGSLANSGYKLDVIGSARIAGNATNDDIVKDTSSDFTQGTFCSGTGYCSTNVSTTSNDLSMLVDNSSAAVAPSSSISTPIPVSSGSAIMRRQNGTVGFLGGVAGSTARIYSYVPQTNSFIPGPNLTNNAVGSGSAVFQRPDGKFMIFYGNRSDIYDPAGSNFFGSIVAGPPLPIQANVQYIAGAGSKVIPRSDGKFLLLLGGSQYTVLYDPVVNTVANGPVLSGAGYITASGSAVFQRQDGKWIVVLGGNTTNTNIYDPTAGSTGLGAFSAGPALNNAAGPGANVFQLPNGQFMVINGNNSKNTDLYNFATNSFTAGSGNSLLSDPAGTGSHAFQRPDNKWVVVIGNGSNATDIYDPVANTFTRVTSNLPNSVGLGAGAFQKDDGTYLILNGQVGTNSTIYDVGWETSAVWTSEDITSTKISTYSAILWDSSPSVSASPSAGVEVFVKTAPSGSLGSANYNLIQNSGDLIQTAPGATQVKVQIQFNSPIAPPFNQVVGTNFSSSGMWGSEGSTEYMRYITQPTVYDFKIQNPIAGYGGILTSDSTESRNAATRSATFDGVVTDNSNRVTLATSRITSDANSVIIASAAANFGATPGAGANVLQLPNGKFLIMQGGGSQVTKIYDSTTGLFSNGPSLVSGNANTGTFSIPLPDGRFLVTAGGSTGTNIYDPVRNTFYAGPTLTANTGAGGHAIQRSDGRFVLLLGGSTTTNIYDPFLNSIVVGPVTSAAVAAGAMSFKRPDGKYITLVGGAATVNEYEETSNTFVVGTVASAANGAGAQAIQMANGNFFILNGGAATTKIYDVRTGIFTAGASATGTLAAGAVVIPLPDGKIWYLIGASLAAYVMDIPANAPAPASTMNIPSPNNPGAGTVAFQRPDGKWVIILGTNGSGNTLIIDAGWNTQGTYITEPINSSNLTSNTSLYWKNVGQGTLGVQERTAQSLASLTASTWNDIERDDGYITPNNGDTWAQFRFNFQGVIPNNLYEKERVFSAPDSGGAVKYYTGVQAPILQYWRLLNSSDPNLLTLQSEGMNAFRFSADGQAYTAPGGAWNSGGADLAERYTSTQDLQAGEVVVGDRFASQNVIRSTTQYQSNIMGVVSTQPGFVAGAYTPDSYPVALVGRVPVKISTENGSIHAGDYLTSASIPGYAMKATVAGRVLGTALEDFDPSNSAQVQTCPTNGAGSLSSTQCGTITAFINLTNYNGQNVELAMADQNFVASATAGFSDVQGDTGGLNSYMSQVSEGDRNILAYLESLREAGSAAFNSSEVFTGRVVAGEVISPSIIADLIVAKTIKADHIEGLEILTNQISSLQSQVSNLQTATDSAVLGEATPSAQIATALNLSELNVQGIATISADLNVKGNGFIQGALNVLDSLTTNNLLVSGFSYFINDVVFKGNVRFNSTPTFNSDTAGFAVIKQGKDTVQVTFDNEYTDTPVVTASIALDKTGDNVSQKALEDAILNGNITYVITQRTTKGFVIKLNKPAAEDINFSWVALSVQNAKTSGLTPVITPESTATQSAAFQSILNQITTPTPTQQ